MIFGLDRPVERAGGAIRRLPVAHAHASEAATTTVWRAEEHTVESTFYGVLIARL